MPFQTSTPISATKNGNASKEPRSAPMPAFSNGGKSPLPAASWLNFSEFFAAAAMPSSAHQTATNSGGLLISRKGKRKATSSTCEHSAPETKRVVAPTGCVPLLSTQATFLSSVMKHRPPQASAAVAEFFLQTPSAPFGVKPDLLPPPSLLPHQAATSSMSTPPILSTWQHGKELSGNLNEWRNIENLFGHLMSTMEQLRYAMAMFQHRLRFSDVWGSAKSENAERFEEVKRRADQAVQEIKKQALNELQKAVAAAERKAVEMIAAERERVERVLVDAHKFFFEQENRAENCWNCGRRANQTCSGCQVARYCGAFCQHRDWDRHRPHCSPKTAQKSPLSVDVGTAESSGVKSEPLSDSSGGSPDVERRMSPVGESVKSSPTAVAQLSA